jgi:purine nucleosidase
MNKKKVLLDTDIGSDIDDAVCLAYLLRQPRCKLLGITTVSGQPVERAMLASCLCKAAGKDDIPIYPGCESVLLGSQLQVTADQASVLPQFEHRQSFPMNRHIQFMIDTIRNHPGEITLLAIGPMTNVALLFAADPEIPHLLKELVLMCGVFGSSITNVPRVEWNAKVDPFAAAMVYSAKSDVHRSVGLDVTCQLKMPANQVRSAFSTDLLLQTVLSMAEVWFTKRDVITFHDPLAAVTLFSDDVCRFEKGSVEVELSSPYVKGMTFFKPSPDGYHEVALGVDSKIFYDEFFGVFEGAGRWGTY